MNHTNFFRQLGDKSNWSLKIEYDCSLSQLQT